MPRYQFATFSSVKLYLRYNNLCLEVAKKMRKRLISIILVLANVLSLVSCSMFDTPETSESPKESKVSGTKEEVFATIGKIGNALADCNFDKFTEYCVASSHEMERKMPVIKEEDSTDYTKPRITDQWRLMNLIATSITYEIDEDSFQGGIWGSKCSVDVKFSYKDYRRVKMQKKEFLGPAEFNTILQSIDETVDQKYTLEFVKDESGKHFVLANPDDLVSIYDYNVSDVKFFKLFDMVKKCYMTGDNWDEKTSTYKDTNTFTIVYKLDERAKDYVWTYIYAVALQTSPEWTYLYTSKTIIDENPEEITITYTQEENFKDGPYVFFIYDQSTKQLTGLQFFVKNTPSETDPSASESTSETT